MAHAPPGCTAAPGCRIQPVLHLRRRSSKAGDFSQLQLRQQSEGQRTAVPRYRQQRRVAGRTGQRYRIRATAFIPAAGRPSQPQVQLLPIALRILDMYLLAVLHRRICSVCKTEVLGVRCAQRRQLLHRRGHGCRCLRTDAFRCGRCLPEAFRRSRREGVEHKQRT